MRPRRISSWIPILAQPLSMCFWIGAAWGDDATRDIDFVRHIRPIFQRHCYACHAADKQKSGLRLDVKAAAFHGGELYGASIVPGDAGKSPLIQFIQPEDAELQMPPEGERLSAAEIELLTRWVNSGAEWPEGVDLAQLEDRTDHWSFHPVSNSSPPQVANDHWPRDTLDQFVLARLEQTGLEPAPECDRVTWLRRVTFDLTGLPPTPERAAEFLADRRPTAYEAVVDELLDSPRYGERWAQHWLDVVRYADTHGFEVNTERPHAWPYRDYVIEAFNRDTPYDQFIREQLIGEQLGADAATGFLVTASVLLPGQIGKDEPSKRLARQDSLDEIVNNIGQTFLGLSIGCARCHDHKFDPISQREYYAMQAFVAGVEYLDREIRTPEFEARQPLAAEWKQLVAEIDQQLQAFVPLARACRPHPEIADATQPANLEPPALRQGVNSCMNVDRLFPVTASRLRFTILATNSLEPCIDELEVFSQAGVNMASASRGTLVTSSGNRISPNRHELRFVNDGQYGNSRSWMSDQTGGGWVELEFPEPVEIHRVVWGRDREGKFRDRLPIDYRIDVMNAAGEWSTVADASDRQPFSPDDPGQPVFVADASPESAQQLKDLLAEKEKLERQIKEATTVPLIFAGKFRAPDAIHVLRRGDPEQPLDLVEPAVPAVLGTAVWSLDTPEPERRRQLADWIAHPENRLTARVMVNRIWQGHFGTGLVDTPNDFGRLGTLPSHPELLDWLAGEFVRSGWSIKKMHRLIVLSATYRQSSQVNAAAAEIDSENRLLWRYPSRRLEGEAIRDSILAVSGTLNLKMGGPGFNLFDKRGGLSGFQPVEFFPSNGLRRMIYAHQVRRERDAIFGAFDCPDGGQSTPRRRESTTPVQALNLLNSRFVIDQSEAFAARVESEVGSEIEPQLQRAFQLALCRDPDREERTACQQVVAEHGLSALCRALLNSSEFLYLP